MFIGVLYMEIHMPGVTCLKGKRRIVQSIKANIRNKFNASVSEVDFQDKWQRAAIGVAIAGGERAHIEVELHKALSFVENRDDLEVTTRNIEFHGQSAEMY
jgi:uncharacterized protein